MIWEHVLTTWERPRRRCECISEQRSALTCRPPPKLQQHVHELLIFTVLALLEKALNDRDPLLLSNMGVAHLELGSQSLALRYYRRALAVDRHNVNARFNCGELLLERGRLRGLAALLALAPADVMQQPEMQALARELQLRKGL